MKTLTLCGGTHFRLHFCDGSCRGGMQIEGKGGWNEGVVSYNMKIQLGSIGVGLALKVGFK